MAQIIPLPSPSERPQETARKKHLEVVSGPDENPASCSLCGSPIEPGARRFVLVSPIGGGRQVVCYLCRKAALSEGYRPAV
jgi:hypothetical protein